MNHNIIVYSDKDAETHECPFEKGHNVIHYIALAGIEVCVRGTRPDRYFLDGREVPGDHLVLAGDGEIRVGHFANNEEFADSLVDEFRTVPLES